MHVLIKTHRDKEAASLYFTEKEIIKFLTDLKQYKFWTLWWKIVVWDITELDILKLSEVNYDFYEASSGKYYAILEDTEGNEHMAEMVEYDDYFQPESVDVSTDMIRKYYFSSEIKHSKKHNDVSTYDIHKQILTIKNEHINISGNQKYQEFARIFIQKDEERIWLDTIFLEYDKNGKYSELRWKEVQNSFAYLNSIIARKTEIKNFFWMREKCIWRDYPIILKDSE